MGDLTKEQEALIEKCWKEIDKELFQKKIDSREERRNLILRVLSHENLKEMSELEFGEVISSLWASRIFGNKDYLIQKILEENGIEKIKKALENLLYGSEEFERRFDNFLETVKGIGPASVTETLCLFDPEKFGIWNDKVRKALKILKFEELPLNKYRISGKEYEQINNVLKIIARKLRQLGIDKADLLTVDYFLYEVWKLEKEGKIKKEDEVVKEIVEFDHDEIRDFIRDIGIWLGFEVSIEKLIARGARVDVIWEVKIANLGKVTYVFEVHKKGSIDSLIVNLQKALNNPTVQKVIAVSDKKQLRKLKEGVEDLPENFRKLLVFWNVEDVINVHEKLEEIMESISKLELVKSQFEEE